MRTSSGTQTSPIFGKLLYARPASLPATKAPETTVVATSTPLPTANQRTLRQCLSTEADSVAAVCRAFSVYRQRAKGQRDNE